MNRLLSRCLEAQELLLDIYERLDDLGADKVSVY
jgi:hypothetical protein